MMKWIKRFSVAMFCLALLACGLLFAACGETPVNPEQEGDPEVSVSGRIVFECRSEYDFNTDITLSFTPNGAELNVPASLSYRDSFGRTVKAEGFTLVQSGESYSLLDEKGQSYALDLVWNSEDPKDDRVTVYGDFVADKSYAEYAEHEEGERFYLEEGHYGAGKLDVSGKQWRFRCEPIRLADGSELCLYAEADSCTDAFVNTRYGPLQFFTQETEDGSDYLLYCFLIPTNGDGEEKLLVRDVVRFAPDCKKTETRLIEEVDYFLKYGEVVYAADGFDISVGDEVFALYEYQTWEWADGTVHDFGCPAGNLIYGEDADADWLIYEYWNFANDNMCVYFLRDGNEIVWESAAIGWHGIRYSPDGKWATEMFYHLSDGRPVFDEMFEFGRIGEDGEADFFKNADIVKNASGDFTVTADEGAWNVKLQYGGPEIKLIFTVEEISKEVSLSGRLVFDNPSSSDYTAEIALNFTPNGKEELGVPASVSYFGAEGGTATADGFTLSAKDGKYTLSDENGEIYPLEIEQNGESRNVTLHGKFLVSETIEDYEGHEKGKRHYIEIGYFGIGGLDVSGEIYYFYFEDMPSAENDYLFYDTPYYDVLQSDNYGDHCTTNYLFDDGSEYLIYYDVLSKGDGYVMRVLDIQYYSADAEVVPFQLYFIDCKIKYGTRKYAAHGYGKVGDEVFAAYESGGWIWPDGTEHDSPQVCFKADFGTDGECDWMLYYFLVAGGVGTFYFELDANGRPIPEKALYGWRDYGYTEDKLWRVDSFTATVSPEEYELKLVFGLERMGEDGFMHPLPDPEIEKLADGSFSVRSGEGLWRVGAAADPETGKIVLEVTEVKPIEVAGKAVFDGYAEGYAEKTAEIEAELLTATGEPDGARVAIVYDNGQGEEYRQEGFLLIDMGDGYLLFDGAGKGYPADVVWNEEGKENSLTVHAAFFCDGTVEDIEGKDNVLQHGRVGIGEICIEEIWRLHFGEVKRENGAPLETFVSELVPYEKTSSLFGPVYVLLEKQYREGIYVESFFLYGSGDSRFLVTRSVEFYAKDCPVSNAFWDGFQQTAVMDGVVLYVPDFSGAEAGLPYHMLFCREGEKTAYAPLEQIIVLQEEKKAIFCALISYNASLVDVEFGENDVMGEVKGIREGFRCIFAPAPEEDWEWSIDAFFVYDETGTSFSPYTLLSFGYLQDGEVYSPASAEYNANGDGSISVSAEEGEWLVTFETADDLMIHAVVEETRRAINYALGENWAYCETGATSKEADVFFVAPSAVTGGAGRETLDFTRTSARKSFLGAIDMEKGIYDGSARFFAPFYRQAVLYVYSSAVTAEAREGYLSFAYEDVEDAFLYYLRNWNNGRPIILAGFSQGADHCIRLMKKFFSGESALKAQLVACYAIGWRITQEETEEYGLTFVTGESDTGVIVSFNCEAEGIEDSLTIPKGQKALGVNPLNWKTDGTRAEKELNKGACFFTPDGVFIEEIPALTGAYLDKERGALKTPDIDPTVYNNTLNGLVEEGVYHFYDYQFFYRNLQENVATRVKAFSASQSA